MTNLTNKQKLSLMLLWKRLQIKYKRNNRELMSEIAKKYFNKL